MNLFIVQNVISLFSIYLYYIFSKALLSVAKNS